MGNPRRRGTTQPSEGQTQSDADMTGGKQAADARLPGPMPTTRPPFTIGDLRRAIPAHCFKRSYLRGFGYIARDLVFVGALLALAVAFDTHVWPRVPLVVTAAFYLAWWFVQGTVMTGVWVLAHECGHYALFDSKLVCDVVGYLLHTPLLVPYHAWRVTHGKHHSNTGSLEHDEVHVPVERHQLGEHVEESPIASAMGIVAMLVFGWPLYLITNATGPAKYVKKDANHFSPKAVFWRPSKDTLGVLAGDAGVVAMLGALAYWGVQRGFGEVARYYFVPYLIVNAYLVGITYLQHTDTYIPRFREQQWEWLRGALCTIDRPFGRVIDDLIHHISDVHVCHHLFSTMPFYHHVEATEAMKPILGKYHLRDETPIPLAMWRCFTNCRYVADDGDRLMFKSS